MGWSKENQLKYPEAWKKVKVKLQTVNKGKTLSETHKKDCKCAFCSGRIVTKEWRENIKKGMNSPEVKEKLGHLKGKTLTESHKSAIRRGLATPEAKQKMCEARKGKIPANLKIAQAVSPFQKGEKNLNWNPNKQDEYGYEFTYQLKVEILGRDKNKCQECNIRTKRRLDIHHIDGNKLNNSLSNLITLCRSCHLKKHHQMRKQLV
jgi:hypothetical protein